MRNNFLCYIILAGVITILIRVMVFTEDCNLLIMFMTFLLSCIIIFVFKSFLFRKNINEKIQGI